MITNGGAKPNIIPEKSEMEYYVRAPRMADLEVLKAKAIKCFEAAAVATGCKVIHLTYPVITLSLEMY